MFGLDFYPTPAKTIEIMMQGYDVSGLKILEPSAGSGNIVDWLKNAGATVYGCEIDAQLRRILSGKCDLLEQDCMDLTKEKMSHINMIVMNPPFSKQEKHILHLWEIAPDGCDIISLCNDSLMKNRYDNSRKQVGELVDSFGSYTSLGKEFAQADRNTNVEIGLIRIKKPGANYETEFDGFFMDEEREEETGEGIMSYNMIRDIVNRYVEAIKIYDKQIALGVQMNKMISSFFGPSLGFQVTEGQEIITRNGFKQSLQLAGWKEIFDKLKMDKVATTSLREDINKFVRNQESVPFTMRNIYRMLDIVIGTTSSRIDKAIIAVFDKVTSMSEGGFHDWRSKKDIPETFPNRESWKTNSHYLLTKKFIIPHICGYGYSYDGTLDTNYGRGGNNFDMLVDLEKCLCYISGKNWDEIKSFTYNEWARNTKDVHRIGYQSKPNVWYTDHEFFKYKMFKKGTMHFEFLDEDVWAMFNQRVSKIKGYPLFEGRTQTDFQKRQTGRKTKTARTDAWDFQQKPRPVSEVIPERDEEEEVEFTMFDGD